MNHRITIATTVIVSLVLASAHRDCLARGFGGGGGRGGMGGGFGGMGGGGFRGGGFGGGAGLGGGGLGGAGLGGGGLGGAGFGGGAGIGGAGLGGAGFGGAGLGGAGFGGGGLGGAGSRGFGGAPNLGGLPGAGAGAPSFPAGGIGGLSGGNLADRGAAGGLGPNFAGGAAGSRGSLNGGFAGGFAGAAPNRSQINSFLGLPSDEGLHAAAPQFDASAFDVNRGIVQGPRGGYAAGAIVEGPRGNEAARGVAVGPDGGVAAGRGAVGPGGAGFVQGAAVGPQGRVAAGGAVRGPQGGVAARGVVAGPHGYAAGFARVTPSNRYFTAAAVRGNFHDYGVYGRGWYTNHPGAWFAAGWAAGTAWIPATWSSVGAWFGYANVPPVYYDYGSSVVTDGGNVYVDGQDAGSTAQYSEQAASLAAAGAEAQASPDDQWLPLGVFALTKAEDQKSSVVLQLAVNKQRIIRGNETDTATNQTQPIQGSVDATTQRVAFTVGDNKVTVVETGLYNLTKDEAPALIHFGADRTEQWLLVRLKDQGAPAAE